MSEQQIVKLRAVADFVEKHGLEQHVASVGSLLFAPDIQLYEGRKESAIAALLPWAEAFGATVFFLRPGGLHFHMHVFGEIPGIEGRFGVVAITREAESQAIVEAGMVRHNGNDLPVALDVMRTLIRSGKDGAR